MVRVEARNNTTIQCPDCHGDLRDQASEVCSRCQTVTHSDCLVLHGQCPVFGCERLRSRVAILNALLQPEDTEEEAARRLSLSRWTLGLISSIFAFSTTHTASAFKKMFEETGMELSSFSKFTVLLFGTWNGWSSVFLTVPALFLNRILGRRFLIYREQINTAFSFTLLVILPILLVFALFSPLVIPPGFPDSRWH